MLEGERGTSIVEVIVSVVILSIFGIVAMATVSQGAVTSADNRARIGAAGLAQRELDEAGTKIAASAEGASLLIGEGLVANPNPQAGLSVGATGDYGFSMDGQKYRVEREASLYDNHVNSPCTDAALADQSAQGTLVTVTVTWEGMSAGTKPHVASKVFPPHGDASAGSDPTKAQLVVKVEGDTGSGPGPRQGITVNVSSSSGGGGGLSTDASGCVVFVVTPDPGGTEYEVTLGAPGGGQDVWDNGDPAPVKTQVLYPGKSEPVRFLNYSLSGRVSVTVNGTTPEGTMVVLEPMWAAGATAEAEVITGTAVFEHVAPGTYSIWIDGSLVDAVSVAPGGNEVVVLP
ncbi:MAG: hypothetical protein LBK59_04595 [Bifidobacteriaceae bacterium]|nr:hypothetical protein [Bifidobacteriaceae bacterium]